MLVIALVALGVKLGVAACKVAPPGPMSGPLNPKQFMALLRGTRETEPGLRCQKRHWPPGRLRFSRLGQARVAVPARPSCFRDTVRLQYSATKVATILFGVTPPPIWPTLFIPQA